MGSLRVLCALALCLASLALLATPSLVHSADDELAVIVHPSVPVGRMSNDALEAVFTLSMQSWSNGDRVVPLNYEARSPMRVAFDRAVLRLAPDQVSRFWIDRRIRGQGTSPRVVPTSDLMVRVIARLPGSIGYVRASMGMGSVKVVARVRNGEVVAP